MSEHRFNPRILAGGNGKGDPGLHNPNIPIIGKKFTPMPCPHCGSLEFTMLPVILLVGGNRVGESDITMELAPTGKQSALCLKCFKDPFESLKKEIEKENKAKQVNHAENSPGSVPGSGPAQP